MTHLPRPHASISRAGILVLSALIEFSRIAAAGSNVWTGGHPGLAAPARTTIATDPSNPSVVYAAFDSDLYRSADGGRTWTRLGSLTDDRFIHVLSLFVSPASPSTLFAGLETGLLRSADGGRTWTPLLSEAITAFAAQPSDPSVLYAGSADGLIWRGPNGGSAWDSLSSPGSTSYAISSLLFGDRDDGRLYAAGSYDVITALDYGYGVNSALMVSKSTDLGAHWVDLSASIPPQYGLYVKDLVAGSSAQELFAAMGLTTPDRRLAHSADGGNTWDPKFLQSLPESVELERLAVDSERPGTLYAGTSEGIYRTTDGGRTWLPFSPSLAAQDVTTLVLGGRTLHAGTSLGAFELEVREGAVDVAAGPSGTHLLTWSADRLSVRTLPESGNPSETPPEGPFRAWTAVAIADGSDGRSRVLWINGDGRAALEIVGAQGQESVFRFARRPDASAAADVSVGDGGAAHLLWTNARGSAHLSSVDASGAMTDGPAYGPYPNWTAVAVADGPGATWVLWRATDGRVSLSLHRALAMQTVFRFDASPGWVAEDLAVGSDGRPRLLRVNPDGRAEVSTVAADGRLADAQVHANPGFEPLRIAGGPDGLTRLLFSDSDGAASVFLLNPDNSLQSQVGAGSGLPSVAGDWIGTFDSIDSIDCDSGTPASASFTLNGSTDDGILNMTRAGCGAENAMFHGTLDGTQLQGTVQGGAPGYVFDPGSTAAGTVTGATLELTLKDNSSHNGPLPIPGGTMHLHR